MTGLAKVTEERLRQIWKHGYIPDHDITHNPNGELVSAALYAINPKNANYPDGWDLKFKDKIQSKTETERLVVACALLVAEIDRREQ